MMASLLPYNATPAERALEAVGVDVTGLPIIGGFRDPWTCPAALLPWLAWSLSVDVWDMEWPEQIKRQVIAESIAVHRVKGTVGAVRRALAATGTPSSIVEWWQRGGAPYTFAVRLDVGQMARQRQPYGAFMVREIAKSVDATKPVRAHYTIEPFAEETGTVHVGAFAVAMQRLEVFPLLPKAISESAEIEIAAVAAINGRVDILE